MCHSWVKRSQMAARFSMGKLTKSIPRMFDAPQDHGKHRSFQSDTAGIAVQADASAVIDLRDQPCGDRAAHGVQNIMEALLTQGAGLPLCGGQKFFRGQHFAGAESSEHSGFLLFFCGSLRSR